jgi:2-iminobutanoate/2-iminopropanoate deaminase
VPLRSISTASAPNPVGPYSQAIVAGGFVFTAGQIGLDPATGNITLGLDAQVNQALDNIRAVLTAAGLDVTDIVKVTFFLTDMSTFGAVNAIYERFLGTHRPARTTVGVAALPGGSLFEVDAIALARQ